MKRQIDPQAINARKLHKKTFWFNIAIMVLSIVATCCMTLTSFLSVNFKIELNEKMISKAFDGALGSVLGSDSGENGKKATKQEFKVDLNDLSTKEKTIKLFIKLDSKFILANMAKSDEDVVVGLIMEQISSIMQQAKPIIKTVMKVGTKFVTNKIFDEIEKQTGKSKTEIKDDIKNRIRSARINNNDLTEVSDKDVDNLINDVSDTMADYASGDKTKEQVSEKVMESMDIIVPKDSGIKKEDVKKQINEILEKFSDSSGKFNLEEALAQISDSPNGIDTNGGTGTVHAGSMLANNSKTLFVDGSKMAAGNVANIGAVTTTSKDTQGKGKVSNVTAEGYLENKIRTLLLGSDGANASILAWAIRALGFIIILNILVWGSLFLKTGIKTFVANNKGVRVWGACLTATFFFCLFVAIPNIAVLVAMNIFAKSGALGGIGDGIGEALLGSASLSFVSVGLIVAFAVAFVLFVGCWVYRPLRKQNKIYGKGIKSGVIAKPAKGLRAFFGEEITTSSSIWGDTQPQVFEGGSSTFSEYSFNKRLMRANNPANSKASNFDETLERPIKYNVEDAPSLSLDMSFANNISQNFDDDLVIGQSQNFGGNYTQPTGQYYEGMHSSSVFDDNGGSSSFGRANNSGHSWDE